MNGRLKVIRATILEQSNDDLWLGRQWQLHQLTQTQCIVFEKLKTKQTNLLHSA